MSAFFALFMKYYERIGLVLLFIVVTSFFLFQHFHNLGWDFMAYVLNGKYLLGQGVYYESIRPPLVSLLLGVFSVFGWEAAEYVYIVFVSSFFLFSVIKLADVLQFNRLVFYSFCLTSYCLTYAVSVGSELLSLSFLALIIAAMLRNTYYGHFLGLAVLARYSFLGFGFLLLLHRNWRQVLKNVGMFVAALSPWLVHNFVVYGNFFFGIADAYANNVYFRKQYIETPFMFEDLFQVVSHIWPLAVVGLGVVLAYLFIDFKENRRDFYDRNKGYLLMLFVVFYTFLSYYDTLIKRVRFFFHWCFL